MSQKPPVKQVSSTRPTLVERLWLGFGLLIVVLALTSIIYYWQIQRVNNQVVQVVEAQTSLEQVSSEMRLDAVNIARSVSDYIREKDLTHLEEAREYEARFKTGLTRFNEVAQTNEAKQLGQEIDNLYEEFVGVADETTALVSQQYTALQSFQKKIEEIRVSINGMLQATIEGAPPDALQKLEAAINWQSSLYDVLVAVEAYTAKPAPDLRQEILDKEQDFQRFGAMYRETNLSTYESSWFDHIEEQFEEIADDGAGILIITDNLYENLVQFQQSFREIDTYLDEQVSPLVHAELLAASENMKNAASSAGKWLLAMVVIGIVAGITAISVMSRKLISPIRDLTNGATIVESGRIDYRFNINAKGEFSQVAIALNKMLENLGRAQAALGQSEEQAWALLDATNDSVILMDLRGAILASNEIAAERFGMTLEQMINESIYDLLPADAAASTGDHVAEAVRLRKPVHYEDEREGKITDQNIFPMFGLKGDITRVAVFSRDVTVRKWVEDVTEQLGRRNELILKAAGEGIYGLDTDGRTTFVNPAAARMLGYRPEDLIGTRHHELVHYARPDGKPYPYEQCPIHAASKDGAVHTNIDDEVFWRKDGTSFPVEYTSTPIIESDRILGAVVTFRDITGRKRVEQALGQSEEKYRSIVESAASLILSLDHEGIIIDSNARVQQILGYTRSEIIDHPLVEFVHPDERANAEKLLKDVVTLGFEYDNHYRMIRKDGYYIAANMNAAVVNDVNGEYIRTICMINRMTKQERE